MNRTTRIRIAVFAIFLVALMGATALVTRNAFAEEAPVIRLTVINTSQFPFTLYIYGEGHGKEYMMKVPAHSDDKIFIQPDMYAYYMEACNYEKNGTMDLTVFQTLHIPVCGGKAAGFRNKSHHIDVSRLVKPVWVKVRNKTGEAVELYLRTTEDHHFLKLESGEILELILKKEEGVQYAYSFLACGGQLITGYYTPRQTPPLDLKCP
jgi:hypothetical protein